MLQAVQLGLTSLRSVDDIHQMEMALHFLIKRAAAIHTAKDDAQRLAFEQTARQAGVLTDSSMSDDDRGLPAATKEPAVGASGSQGRADDKGRATDKGRTDPEADVNSSDEENDSGAMQADQAVTAASQLFTAAIGRRMPSLARKVHAQ